MSKVFKASRYNKGDADYLNCPMTEAEYDAFHQAMLAAEKVVPKEFEKIPYFEGCIPIEVMAERGRSEEHTSELQSRLHLVCRLLLEKKKKTEAPYSHHTSKQTVSTLELLRH